MTVPFFSIVVPAYNRAPFLDKITISAIAQTFNDFEIIVVDDGSRDNTQEVMINLIKTDSRIKYVSQDNKERGAARNNGINNATGQYILFIDSDDIMLPNYLRDLHNLIEKNDGYNFYAARYDFRSGEKLQQSDVYKLPKGPHTLDVVLKGNPFGCNFCIKRNNPHLVLFNEDRKLATTEDWMFLVENLFKDIIFLGDFKGMEMVQHDGRSMKQNQMIIERRIAATKILENQVHLSPYQLNTLWAYTWSFCGTHAYLDSNKSQSLFFIKSAIKQIGPNSFFLKQFLKFSMGRKFINILKFQG